MKEYAIETLSEVGSEDASLALSVIVPVYNEADNIEQLNAKLTDALESLARSYEVIYIDDGSIDQSLAVLRAVARQAYRVRVIFFSPQQLRAPGDERRHRSLAWTDIDSDGRGSSKRSCRHRTPA